jgi:hypothetical protein
LKFNLTKSRKRFERDAGIEHANRRVLLYFVVPLWLGAGLADWWQHRKTHIERNAGAHESAVHLLMLTEAGVPAMLGLFFEVNSGVLLTSFAAFLAHEATAMWDVAYAEPRRRVTPGEQHIHSYLEIGPLMAVALLTALHWDQARALIRVGDGAADFSLRPKREPLQRTYVIGLLAAIGACGALPYVEEFIRCFRYRPTVAPLPAPPEPATPTLRIPA